MLLDNYVPTTVFDLFSDQGFGVVINLLIILLEIIYAVYAFLMVRTVSILNRIFQTGFSPFFNMIALIHLFLAVGLVLISLLSLL